MWPAGNLRQRDEGAGALLWPTITGTVASITRQYSPAQMSVTLACYPFVASVTPLIVVSVMICGVSSNSLPTLTSLSIGTNYRYTLCYSTSPRLSGAQDSWVWCVSPGPTRAVIIDDNRDHFKRSCVVSYLGLSLQANTAASQPPHDEQQLLR